jgi:hypothetical protein
LSTRRRHALQREAIPLGSPASAFLHPLVIMLCVFHVAGFLDDPILM